VLFSDGNGVGWFYGLADKQIGAAISAIHAALLFLDAASACGEGVYVAFGFRRTCSAW